jgi:hypothetical protein
VRDGRFRLVICEADRECPGRASSCLTPLCPGGAAKHEEDAQG